jgi:hypothetical protein
MIQRIRLAQIATSVSVFTVGLGFVLVVPDSRAAVSQTMSGFVTEEDVQVGLSFADGTQVGTPQLPGPVIPPGTYQVSINDTSQVGDFDLAGPGVSFATPVETREQVTWTVSFEPCQTYSYRNDQQSASVEWFQTSASATSTASCAPPLTPPPAGTTTSTTTTSSDAGGATTTSGAAPPGDGVSALGTPLPEVAPAVRGTLRGTVSAAGTLALTLAGKTVSSLAAGHYTLETTDHAAHANFTIQKLNGSSLVVSGTSFVGTRRLTVDLSAGKWMFFSSTAKTLTMHSFTVVG